MAQQTAVDWFFAQVLGSLHSTMSKADIDKALEQAKQMEQEQISSSWHDGNFLGRNGNIREEYGTGKGYYDKTYAEAKKYQVRFRDVDPDTGLVSQDRSVATCETQVSANWVKHGLRLTTEEAGEPNREIYTVEL